MDTKLAAGGALAAAAAAFACFGGVQPESKGLRAGPSGSIVVFVNGVQVVVAPHELHPRMTLLEFLRENRKLSGAKLSCAQGGCGACTVMLTSWDKSCGEWQHRAVNACLRPVLACDGMAILTTEGIGNKQDGFHPVQERIAKCNGSQCGFCTPGQVMSLYSLLRESGGEPLTLDAIEERFDGNICRCTGYRPIMTAAHTFAAEGPLGDKTDITNFAPKFASYDPASEKPPPEGLKQQAAATLSVTSTDGSAAWFRVGSLSELDAVRASTRGQKSTLVVGNTMTGPYGPNTSTEVFIDIAAIPELNGLSVGGDSVTVGAAVSISKLMSHLTSNASLSASFPTLVAHMKRVGNWQVRNVGCWAGNLTMAKTLKFASDLATIFMGAGALLTVRYQGQTSVMSVYDYLWTEHDMDELLVLSMEIPALAQGEVFQTYRSAIRQNSAHALLNAAFRVTVSEEGVITAASLAFGLAQDRAVFATAAQELLVGRKPDPQTLALVLQTLEGFELIEETHYKTVYQPEGKESYRRSLVNSFVYKFLVHLMGSEAPASIASTTSVYARGPSSGKQTFQTVLPAEHPGSRPQPKIEAEEQASGETIFHDDEGLNGCLHACFVPCTKAPARVVSIDPAEALKMPGVVAFVDAADIPGANTVAFASPGAEELFVTAGNSTVYVGQPVGCIVANTRREAEAASAAVQVVYAKEQEGIYSLEDAIEKKSYQAAWAEPRTKEAGDSTPEDVFSQVRASGGTVIEGEMRIGGQSHFAMEKNICLAIPQDCGRFELHHSTQMPDAARGYVAGAIQSSQEKIQIICRRLGGGFGGKATKNIPTSIAATVCARKLKQPVKLANSIGQDMMMAGNARHPMLVKWKLAADKSGTIKAVDCCSYIDAGCAEDFSDFIAGEMLENIENCYNVPVYRSKVYLLKTNTASNTAVRAPGLIQALAVTETMLDELAAELSIDKEALRVKNMMTQAECTPNVKGEGAPIAHYNLPRIWKELNQSAKFEERQAAVDAFNASNRWKKRGLAAVPMRYGLGHGHVAGSNVTINVHAGDGSIEVFHSGQEMGQGLTTKCATTISAALGVPLDKIYVHGTNTSVVPNDTVSGGSTTSEAVCRAADLACEDLLARLAPVASKLNESKRAEDSTDSAAAAEATWEEIVAAAWGGGGGAESLSVNRKYSAEGSEINPKGYFGLGAGCTEVEVDVLTGQVSVLRADILYDCGHSLNPTIDIGQAEGAYVMGLGFFLQEETMYSPEGELISDGTWEYKPPLYNDIPEEFNVTLLKDSPFPNGVRSSKAVGEPPLLMAVSALTATRAAIRASRLERGRSGRFALCVPATVDRVQAAADVTADELVLKVVREFVPAAQA